MWFKNLTLFRLGEVFDTSPEQLAAALEKHAARPCASLEPFTVGWAPPTHKPGAELVHAANGRILICLVREERLLPGSVIREAVDQRIADIEESEARRVRSKERRNIRDDITFELLPKAFTRKLYTHAYLSPPDGWLIVDTATPNKAEELLVMLGSSLGELAVQPFKSEISPTAMMTKWLAGRDLPRGLSIQYDCELRDPADDSSVVRCQRQDLASDEIQAHLRAHKQVHKLALGFEDRISFILRGDLSISRLRFESVDELDYQDHEDELARFDADFAFMTTELGHLLTRLADVFDTRARAGAAA